MIQPFDMTGIRRDAAGVAHYDHCPASVLAMLRATVDRMPRNPAIVEVGGLSVTYAQLWDRSARIAGGLRDLGVRPGDRVAIRLPNGLDWCLAFFGTLM